MALQETIRSSNIQHEGIVRPGRDRDGLNALPEHRFPQLPLVTSKRQSRRRGGVEPGRVCGEGHVVHAAVRLRR